MGLTVLLTAFVGLTLAFPLDGDKGPARVDDVAEVVEAQVLADGLDVFDQPRESGYIIGGLSRGDRVRIRLAETSRPGWLAIEAPSTAVCWIEESAIELPQHDDDDADTSIHARVRSAKAVVRSGNLLARLPGPPCETLERGERVQLVDRPALVVGSDRGQRWRAIVPPLGRAFFVQADGVGWEKTASPPPPPPAEMQAAYEPQDESPPQPPSASPASGLDAELKRIDGMLLAVTTGQPVERWQFTNIREECQTLLKQAKDRPDLEEALRSRLATITRYEQAANAARSIVATVSKSRKRDEEVARIAQKLASSEQERLRAFDAVGFVQPSVRKVDGRKVYALIGREGAAVAYLDIPPGLDPEPLMTYRVGVRGRSRYNGELGIRVIAVSDLENLEPKR